MSPEEILKIVQAFFDAIKNLLIALGIMKPETKPDESTDNGNE